jgi:hypothetical protein
MNSSPRLLSQHKPLSALHIVLQHLMLPDLGWNRRAFDIQLSFLRRRIGSEYCKDTLLRQFAQDLKVIDREFLQRREEELRNLQIEDHLHPVIDMVSKTFSNDSL